MPALRQARNLREVQLLALVILDWALATGAPPARLERGTAQAVAGNGGVCRVAHRPAFEHPDRPPELVPRCGQLVHEPWRPLGVRRRDDECDPLEVTQTLAEDIWGNSAYKLLQFPETSGALQQRGDDQQCPPVADRGERVSQGGMGAPVGRVRRVGRVSRAGVTRSSHGAIVGPSRLRPVE